MGGDKIFAATQRVVKAAEDPDMTDRERLDALALAWQFVAQQARDAALALPGGFPAEREWQVDRLEAQVERVRTVAPDLEAARMAFEGDTAGLIEHFRRLIEGGRL